MTKCVVVAYGRSAVGKARKGSLAKVNPVDYGAEVLAGVVKRVPQLNPEDIDDVIVGCAIPEGKMGLNAARNIILRAGLPQSIPGQTLTRFCSSGIQSVANAAAMIESGMQTVVVAGGVESMSEPVLSEQEQYLDKWLLDNTDCYIPMGFTAENVANKYGVSRTEMDQMAVESNAKAAAAVEAGEFDKEIIPVHGIDKEGHEFLFQTDECYRKGTNLKTLATLRPAFKEDGQVTAATSSQMSDGAGFLVLMSEEKAAEIGAKPIAYFEDFAVAGLDPAYMGLGPIYATRKLLARSNYQVDDFDVIELNEAFASQALVSMRELNLPKDKVNPRGGALALGHPLGATGAILLCKAMGYLADNQQQLGLVTMCIGGGMGAAGIIRMAD